MQLLLSSISFADVPPTLQFYATRNERKRGFTVLGIYIYGYNEIDEKSRSKSFSKIMTRAIKISHFN